MVAQFIADNQAGDVLDDGNLVGLEAQFVAAIVAVAAGSGIIVSRSGTTGQMKLPGGLIVKWGPTPMYGTDTATNTFVFPATGGGITGTPALPGPFPNAVFGGVGQPISNLGVSTVTTNYSVGLNQFTTSQMNVTNDSLAGVFFYIVLGY
jgi:hypothetical protein